MPRISALTGCRNGFHQGGQLLGRRAQHVAGGTAQHQTRQQAGVTPVEQLGDHAAHGVPDGDERADAEGLGQRGDIVRAILKPKT
jgi:hypothetical protein